MHIVCRRYAVLSLERDTYFAVFVWPTDRNVAAEHIGFFGVVVDRLENKARDYDLI